MPDVLIGIGSNLGDRAANIERAITLLKEKDDIDVLQVSSFIETTPEGGVPQGDFLNGAAKLRTELSPLDLLSRLKNVERRLGRVRKDSEPGAPRTIDLDILFYDDIVIVDGKNLDIPHPRLATREFVLKPLLEIAPDFVHPRLNKSVRELLESLAVKHENHGRQPEA